MRKHTENRFICWLVWWFYESHGSWPRAVLRVYSHREYFTRSGHHVWIEHGSDLRSLYRAIGMIFVWLKKLWDRGEAKLWPEPEAPDYPGGM